LAVAVASFIAVGTLAWQLLTQEHDVELRRRQEQLESSADQLVAAMQQALSTLQSLLDSNSAANLPPDVSVIVIAGDRVIPKPPGRLLYFPAVAALSRSSTPFDNAEHLELSGSLMAASEAYSRSARTSNPVIRGGALLRLGRTHRKSGATAAALKAYDDLDALDATVIEDLPAALVASVGRLETYKAAGRTADARREGEALLAHLHEGRWQVTGAQYATYMRFAREFVPSSPVEDPKTLTLSEIVEDLWRRRGVERPLTRQLLVLPAGVGLVLWRSTSTQLDAIVAGQDYLATLSDAIGQAAAWSISHEGQTVLGVAPRSGATAVRAAVTSGLPWTVHVFPAETGQPRASSRRQLMWLLGVVTAVLGAGWYFVFRSLTREQQMARLQSDFVAAVSHEFRSPLTSLTHAADLLAENRLVSDARTRETYQVLVRDTSRLRSLVEGLLAFGRLEAGVPFQFEAADVVGLARATVEDFREDFAAQGFVVDFSSVPRTAYSRIDRDAITRALRNLLDNAVKYSPGMCRVEVQITREADTIFVAVRDQGIGIPGTEQHTIFQPFVRGATATNSRIRGTGLGLAMVRQIARGHGGEIAVTSAIGQGSVFTLKLPASAEPNRNETSAGTGEGVAS
jgi:signal transduction histidine kinase